MDNLTDFNTSRFYLGNICKRGHNWQKTGHSLRYIGSYSCADCLGVKDFNNDYHKSIVGKVYGRLTVLAERNINRPHECDCICECGTLKTVLASSLRAGRNKSCGCLAKDVNSKRMTTHGDSKTKGYTVWVNMISRCTRPGDPRYRLYGARGITVCTHWLEAYENFIADMGQPDKGMTLERVDNSCGYSKENCIWTSQKQQCRNTRNNKYLTFEGQTLCVTEWAEKVGIPAGTIFRRLDLGWTVDTALTTKVGQQKRSIR